MIAPSDRPRRGIPLRALIPNAVTALALSFGLSGVRFAIGGEWDKAIAVMIVAGVLDGIDGRIARLLKGESRFGAELDSLSDVIAFGVSPAIIVYLWSLQAIPQFGWIFALAHVICCALRLARFNANIDSAEQPHKSAGFLTGVPAPTGAGLAVLPIFIWLATGWDAIREPWIVAPWVGFTAFLMISSIATFSWSSLRVRRNIRLEAIVGFALLGAALVSTPWWTLTVLAIGYLLTIPFSVRSYARVRRLRASPPPASQPAPIASEQPRAAD